MKTFYLTLLSITILLFSPSLIAGEDWSHTMGSSGDDVAMDVYIDPSGNSYIVGSFTGTVDFDPGTGVTDLISNGASEIFIQKLNPYGELIWVHAIGGVGYDQANAICADGMGNIYIVGYFEINADFDPGPALSVLSSNGGLDIFVLAMDADGNFIRAGSIGGVGVDIAYDVAPNAVDGIYLTGGFSETADLDPGAGVLSYTSQGSNDIFVEKLDANGSLMWVQTYGSTQVDQGISLVSDLSDNVYIAGNYSGTVDFDAGIGVNEQSALGSTDVFYLKLDGAGGLSWIGSSGGLYADKCQDLVLESETGNMYVCGSFVGDFDADPTAGSSSLTSIGAKDVFIQKLNNSGDLLWGTSIGGDGADIGTAITIDPSGSIYLSGMFEGTVDFDPGPGISNYTSTTLKDGYILSMDASGNFENVQLIASDGDVNINSIASFDIGQFICVGGFDESIQMSDGASLVTYSSAGGSDIFTSNMSMSSTVEIKENNETQPNLYPNPSNGAVTINLAAYHEPDITIMDQTGRVVKSYQRVAEEEILLDLDLSAGKYFVHLITSDRKQVAELIVL